VIGIGAALGSGGIYDFVDGVPPVQHLMRDVATILQ